MRRQLRSCATAVCCFSSAFPLVSAGTVADVSAAWRLAQGTEQECTAVETDLAFLRDAYTRSFDAAVVAIDGDRIALDRTFFYPTGGGQPNDLGILSGAIVRDVRK